MLIFGRMSVKAENNLVIINPRCVQVGTENKLCKDGHEVQKFLIKKASKFCVSGSNHSDCEMFSTTDGLFIYNPDLCSVTLQPGVSVNFCGENVFGSYVLPMDGQKIVSREDPKFKNGTGEDKTESGLEVLNIVIKNVPQTTCKSWDVQIGDNNHCCFCFEMGMKNVAFFDPIMEIRCIQIGSNNKIDIKTKGLKNGGYKEKSMGMSSLIAFSE